MIKVHNLSKSFQRKQVLHSINLELDSGVYGMLGANGAGKTTLLRCMAGLFDPQQGEVLYNDKNLIGRLNQDKMILISTHIVEDVDACCGSVIVIDEGQILFNGSCVELKNIALNKVYQVEEADLAGIAGEKFSLKINEIGGKVYHRILARDKQAFPSEDPSLEDGYMCLIKGFA